MTRLRRSRLMTHHSRALMLVKDGENMILAERFDDALPLYKLAASHLAESHDARAPELRKVVEKCIAWLEKKLGLNSDASDKIPAAPDAGAGTPQHKPALSKTEPNDLDAVFGFRRERTANAEVIREVDEENLKKAGGE